MENVPPGPGQHQEVLDVPGTSAATTNPSTTPAAEQTTTPAVPTETETPQKQASDQQAPRDEDEEDSEFDELDGMSRHTQPRGLVYDYPHSN